MIYFVIYKMTYIDIITRDVIKGQYESCGFSDIIFYLARRARYKVVEENYCHFVLNNYRIEFLADAECKILCVVKCKGGKRKSNDCTTNNENTFYLTDGQVECYDNIDYVSKFFKTFMEYSNSIKGYRN